METLQKNISNLIEQQFPAIYRESGPTFVAFVQEYYKWMEQQGGITYYTRRMPELWDIDETLDQFVNHFRNKYLTNIQLDTVQSTRTLVKHSLDLYRSKGTERSIELLFRAAFGVGATIYYPGNDLFKLSDGKWSNPSYLEVNLDPRNKRFASKQIIGLNSKATAFVESVVRRKANNKTSDVIYISNVKGRFKTGEKIIGKDEQVSVNLYQATVIGSLTEILVDVGGSGTGFEIGDLVDVSSTSGYQAKARVANVTQQSGLIDFKIIEGGYGFNSNSTILLSTKNITIPNTTTIPIILETIYQPFANLHYLNANGNITTGQILNSYYANNLLRGSASVLSVVQSNSSAGYIFAEILSGNVNSNAIYTSGNTVGANLSIIDGYTDKTANGLVVGYSIDSANALKIGIANITNQFMSNSHVFTSNSSVSGIVYSVSSGSGGSFAISNNLLYPEYVNINTDLLSAWGNTRLNANTYGFPANTSANASSPMISYLGFANTLFGKIQTLVSVNPGQLYSDSPFLSIVDSNSSRNIRLNSIVGISNVNSNFSAGEIITQAATSGRALIISANQTALVAQNLRVDPANWIQINSSIVGSGTGATANVISVTDDLTSNAMGRNAIVAADK